MDHVLEDDWQERVKSAVAVVTLHALVGYALISGMGMEIAKSVDAGLKVIDIAAPPPEPVLAEKPAKAEEAPASPKNLRAKPTQIVAPKPVIDLKIESPVLAAPIVGAGNDNDAGAANQPGPGFGNGGDGDGLGGGGIVSGPRHLSGAIGRKDIPRAVWKARNRGNVVAHFTVGVDGLASNCQIRQSSGHPVLDETTCRLIEQRFRFEPARDARGRAVAQPYGWLQQWWQDGRGPQRVN